MKDVAGREFREGDTVAFGARGVHGRRAALELGTVVGFTDQRVKVVRHGTTGWLPDKHLPAALAILESR